MIGGGAAVQERVAKRWQQVTGRYITEGYGLTEASPVACANPLGTPWNGSIGMPYPSTESLVRDDAFNELPVWTSEGDIEKHTGEICIRGPQVMKGYWNKPEETALVLRNDWLYTGDVARKDQDGYFYIVDRKKDMIIAGGYNVYPREVESVVATHPGVLECGVVGVPDAKSGEAVKVVVVKKDPNLAKEAVVEHCRGSSHRLQAAASCGVSRRLAEVADRKGPAAGAARRAETVTTFSGRNRDADEVILCQRCVPPRTR